MATAVSEGMGIVILPICTVIGRLKSGDVVRVMPDYTSQLFNVDALYSSGQYLDAKIRTLVHALRDQLSETLTAEQAALSELTPV